MNKLKEYDGFLEIRKTIDWKKTLIRKSQYNSWIDYPVMDLSNMRIWNWLISKLQRMDSRNNDFIYKNIMSNEKIRNKKTDNRMSKDISRFIRKWEQIIL